MSTRRSFEGRSTSTASPEAVTIDHVIEPAATGTVITERATMSGPLAAIAARLLGSRLAKTFTATTVHTADLAETADDPGRVNQPGPPGG
jgi:hypothetical protein